MKNNLCEHSRRRLIQLSTAINIFRCFSSSTTLLVGWQEGYPHYKKTHWSNP